MDQPWIVARQAPGETLVGALEAFGFAIVPHAIAPAALDALYGELAPDFAAAEFCEGLFYGHRTKRFGRVIGRSRQAQHLAMHDLAVGTARTVLGPHCGDIQLNLTQAIEIWPNSFAQAPHRDQDIWLGSNHTGELMLNAMWALDDFTAENGATRIWPGSHRLAPTEAPEGEGVCAEMPRGSLCLFLGSTLHAGGANWSAGRRRGLVMSYCLGWLKPCENPWLSYPPEIAQHFTPELRRLVGYRQDAPSLNNLDGRCPSELFDDRRPGTAFADRLTPDQSAQILQFNAMQLAHRPKAA